MNLLWEEVTSLIFGIAEVFTSCMFLTLGKRLLTMDNIC